MAGVSIHNRFKVNFVALIDKGNRIVSEKKGKARMRSDLSNLDYYYLEVAEFLKAQLLKKGKNVIEIKVNSIESEK